AHRPSGRDLQAVIGTAAGQRKVTISGDRLSIRSARPTSLTIEVLDDSHHVLASIRVPLNAVPAVRIVNPSAGQTVFGITSLSAQATDRVGVRSVTFFLDGRRLGPADRRAPYALKWDTRQVPSGR